MAGDRYTIPRHIKPELRSVHIEILCWGLRLDANSKLSTGTPVMEFDCNGQMTRSQPLPKDSKAMNFKDPVLIIQTVGT